MIRVRQIFRPARIARSLFIRLRGAKHHFAEIGPYTIRMPADSRLLNYQSNYHLYNTALGRIASVLNAKYPTLHAIDIGANVGDTAALIRESAEIPVLCIEGDPSLFPILAENIARLGRGVEVEHSFVGPDGTAVNLELAQDRGHNTCLVGTIDTQGSVKLRSLRTILADHPDFAGSKLLKTDTEGFDFDILRQSLEIIQQAKPVVFFEYNPGFRPDELLAGLETIQSLIGAGYSDFIYYDNFGNLLLHVEATSRSILNDLDKYLASNRRHGVAVHYFDICALHKEDADLVPEIMSLTQR